MARPERAPAQVRELLADVRARRLARGPPAHQRLARLEHERLDLLAPHAQDGRDLLVGVVADLEQDERRALIGRKALHVVHEHAQVRAPVDLRREPLGGRSVFVELDLLAPRAHHREAAVARDGVEPGLEVDDLVARPQRAIGGQEGVLQDVLGLLARAEHVLAEREQPAVVGVVERLERGIVPAANPSEELGLGLRRRPAAGARSAGAGRRAPCHRCRRRTPLGDGFPSTASLTQRFATAGAWLRAPAGRAGACAGGRRGGGARRR